MLPIGGSCDRMEVALAMQKTSPQHIPELVHIVLSQLARRFNEGQLSERELNEKLSRLEREDLSRRGFHLQKTVDAGGKLDLTITDSVSAKDRLIAA
jgi:hypothetical protein